MEHNVRPEMPKICLNLFRNCTFIIFKIKRNGNVPELSAVSFATMWPVNCLSTRGRCVSFAPENSGGMTRKNEYWSTSYEAFWSQCCPVMKSRRCGWKPWNSSTVFVNLVYIDSSICLKKKWAVSSFFLWISIICFPSGSTVPKCQAVSYFFLGSRTKAETL